MWLRKLRFLSFILMVILCISIPFAVFHRALQMKSLPSEKITDKISEHLKKENSDLDDLSAERISQLVYEESKRYRIDYRLVLALMKVESNFQYDAVSENGAMGLLQVKPAFAKYIAQDLGIAWKGSKTLHEPDANIKIGVHFLSSLIDDFKSTNMALKAYNIGPTKLKELSIEDIKPSRGFLGVVMSEYQRNVITLPTP